MKRCMVLLVFACAGLAHCQLTAAERKGIQDALFVGNMTVDDLNYDRTPFHDKYRLALVDEAIQKPLDAADSLMEFHKSGSAKTLSALILSARTRGLGDPKVLSIVAASHPEDPELKKLPEPLRAPVKRLVDSVADSNAIIRKATAALSADDRRYLIETLPLYANEDSSIKFDFTKRTTYDSKRILSLIDKVDLVSIRAGAQNLASSVEALRPQFEACAKNVREPFSLKLRIEGLRVDVSGIGDDVHSDSDAVVSVDLGGNNTYRGRCGAGVGYASVLLDLGTGTNVFEVPDLSLGAGVLGVGLAYVYGGNVVVRGRSVGLGSGLAGVGAFMHVGGADSYRSVSLAQGYGQFGLGIMLDTAGDDRYSGGYNVQGAARTGGVGWLVDQSGDDVYKAGGLILNSPLFSNVTYSNAQGYASGYREDTGGISGGIGMLTDLGGHDTYIGDTYCQAASYWFSLGSLYDAAGNDTYIAYHYAQASAMHMTAAYLFDLAGDDAYVCKYGACHAIGHDYGVAFLLDRAGMDLYAAHDSRPATGSANGVGIFVDAAGDDRYMGAPAAGLTARGSGSLALFCDLGGTDSYSEGLANGQASAHESWAVAYDAPNPQPLSPPGEGAHPVAAQTPTPGSLPMPPDSEMQVIYAKATQWGVGTAQQEVADNVARLSGIGKPALQWMIEKRLATADRLQIRAFVAVIGALGAEGRLMIAPKVASDNLDEAREALIVCTDAGVKEAGPYLPSALKKTELQRIAARAAGALGSKESVDDLVVLTTSKDKLTALGAVTSLVSIADPSTVGTAQALLSSPELPVRMAAIQLLAEFPTDAVRVAKLLLGSSDVQLARTAVQVLGAVGSPEALDAVGRALASPVAGLRIEALNALNGRVPEAFRGQVLDARKDTDPLVRAVAARVDLGR